MKFPPIYFIPVTLLFAFSTASLYWIKSYPSLLASAAGYLPPSFIPVINFISVPMLVLLYAGSMAELKFLSVMMHWLKGRYLRPVDA